MRPKRLASRANKHRNPKKNNASKHRYFVRLLTSLPISFFATWTLLPDGLIILLLTSLGTPGAGTSFSTSNLMISLGPGAMRNELKRPFHLEKACDHRSLIS